MIKIAMFDVKPYDKEFFDSQITTDMYVKYFSVKLDESTAILSNGFDVVVAFVNDELTTKVIDDLYEYGVKLIAMRCAGFNNVDIKRAYGKIHIVRVPAYSPEAVAEHAVALLLTSIRRIHKAYNRTRDFNFSLSGLEGFNLHGKTVGVIGTGKIGRAFINIMNGFGMKILAYDAYPDASLNCTYTDLDTIYKECDVISLHCPLTDQTKHMINSQSINQMKKGVVIINTSRGGLIDAEALLEGIKARIIGGACLDVYEEESDLFFEDKSGHILGDDILARLLSMPNVLITSHQAFLTKEALQSIAKTTVDNIKEFFNGDLLTNEICYHCENINDCKKARKKSCF